MEKPLEGFFVLFQWFTEEKDRLVKLHVIIDMIAHKEILLAHVFVPSRILCLKNFDIAFIKNYINHAN